MNIRSHSAQATVVSFLISLLFLLTWQAPGYADPVSASQAADMAQRWLQETHLASAPGVQATLATTEPSQPLKAPDGQTLAYVVPLAGKGFVVVAGDTDVDPILYFSTDNRSSGLLDPRNPLRALLLSDVPQRLAVAREHPEVQRSVSSKWAARAKRAPIDPATLVIHTGPFMDTTWDQSGSFIAGGANNYTYNLYTPNHYVAGCVAVALGQVLKWFQFPLSASGEGDIEVDGHDWDDQTFNDTYDYDHMPNALDQSDPDGIVNVARLLASAGIPVEMEYTASASNADTSDIADVLKEVYGYSSAEWSSSSLQTKRDLLYNELYNWRFPAVLAIRETGGGGHAIIADGYAHYSSQEAYHFNMGWGGADNGWYILPSFSTSSFNWNVFRGVITYIRPQVRRGVDLLIAAMSFSMTYNGENIYNDTAQNQSSFDVASPTFIASYEVRLHNEGSYPDYLKVHCPAGLPNWSVRFLDTNRVDITAAVTSTGFVSTLIRPGQDLNLTLEMRPSNSVPVGTSTGLLIRGYSNSDLTKRDAVLANVRVESSRPNLLIRPLGATHPFSNRLAGAVLGAEQTNRYEVIIRNDGGGVEMFYPSTARANLRYLPTIFFGDGGDTYNLTNWNVVWRDNFGRDVTVLMDCGWWWTPSLAPAATQLYTVSISPNRLVSGGHGLQLTTRARTEDRSVTDTLAINTIKSFYFPELRASPDDITYGTAPLTKIAATNYSATYYLKIRNSGNASDRPVVKASMQGVSGGSWQASVQSLPLPGTNITAEVFGTGWTLGALAPNEERTVRLDLQPLASASYNETCLVTCAVGSWGDVWITNSVQCLALRGAPGVQVQAALPGGTWNDLEISSRLASMATTSFYVRIINQGAFADRFNLRVQETNCEAWTLTYYDSIGQNITFLLYGDSYLTSLIAPNGGYDEIRVTMQPSSSLTNRAVGSTRILAISQADASVTDSVQVAGLRASYRVELPARPASDPVYRTTTANASCGLTHHAVYFVQARNYGEAPDSFLIQAAFTASSMPTSWTLRCYSDPEGLTNITDAVVGGGWGPGYIEPESAVDLRVDVWASNTVPGESWGRVDLSAFSSSSSSATAGIALVSTKAAYRPTVRVRNAEGGSFGTAIASQRVASATAYFDFLVRNDGGDDLLTLSNEVMHTQWGDWSVRFLDADGNDVSAVLAAGVTYAFTNGETRLFRVEVTPSNSVPPNALCQVVLRAVSQGDPVWFNDQIALVSKATCGVDLKVWNPALGAYTNQPRDVMSLPARPGTYYWEIRNTGEISDYINLFSYHMSDQYSGWTVRHFNKVSGGEDITAWMNAEPGYKIGPLSPGMSYTFRTEVQPDLAVSSNGYCGIFMRADADGYLGAIKYLTASNALRQVGQVETLMGRPSDIEFTVNTITQFTETGYTAQFILRLRNRSLADDSFKLAWDSSSGGGQPAHWALQAYNAREGGEDVTDLLNDGLLIVGPLAQDDSAYLRLTCTPLDTAEEGEALTVRLWAESQGEAGVSSEALAKNHVLGLLRIVHTERNGSQVSLEWISEPGAPYEIEGTQELNGSPSFVPLLQNVQALTTRASSTLTNTAAPHMIYRVRRQ